MDNFNLKKYLAEGKLFEEELTPLQKYIFDYESDISDNIDIRAIKGLENANDVYDYYANVRGWEGDPDLEDDLDNIYRQVKARFAEGKLNEEMDGGTLFDYFNKNYIVDDHFHSDDSYIVKREPSGKDQYVIFDYDKDRDQFQIRQLGGYQIDRSEAIKAGMRETSRLARAGMDAYMVDGNYSPTPISIKGLKDIVDHVMGGLDREAAAQQDYYARRGPTSGTIDESPKNPGATLGPGPKASEDGVKDNYYVKAFGYKLAPSVKNRKSKAIDYRQLWKENHMYNQTLSEAENDVEQFQQKRINDFDELEKRLDVLQKKLKQGKLSTIRYYREKPESYSVVYGTDMINDYFNDIETLLTQDD